MILDLLDWRRRVHDLYQAVRDEADPAQAHARWIAGRDALYRDHPQTAILPEERAGFAGLKVASYDPAWRFVVPVEPAEPARFEYETATDGIVPFDRLGVARVPGVGTLDIWWLASYGGGLFVPIKDATAGRDGGSYGGGRYLLDTVKGADLGGDDGGLVLDFNFAYNPSCAYDPDWACPLAPAGNTVPVEIPVGERAWHDSDWEPAGF